MSFLIPATQLSRTSITVRFDSSTSAPNIECSLDDQTPRSTSAQDIARSQPFPLESHSTPLGNISNFPNSPAMSQADLNIERGIDGRGHYVRLSFIQAPLVAHTYGQRSLENEYNDMSFFPHQGSPNQSASPLGHVQENTPLPTNTSTSSNLMTNGTLDYSSMQIMDNIVSGPQDSTSCMGDINFPGSSATDLMDAFMGFFNLSHPSEYLDMATHSIVPSSRVNQISEPASPDMSSPPPSSASSSSSSSSLNSPTTPYNFFITAPPTRDGSFINTVGSNVGITHSPPPSKHVPPDGTHILSGSALRAPLNGKSNESRLLPCPQPGCKRQFKSTSTLSGHMKTHAGKGTRFACSFPPCTEKFSRRHDQLRHEVYKHGKQCEWVCSRCNSFFSYERSLEKHTCTMDKSRRGSMPYAAGSNSDSGGSGSASGR